MTQTLPATAVLGPGKTGLSIGYRILLLDGTTYSAFSTTDVTETSTAGTYRKTGGVVAPTAGAYIVWGTALVDYAEDEIEPAFGYTGSATGTGAYLEDLLDELDTAHGAGSWEGSSVDAQDVADALLLAPSGAAADGSAMAYLAGIDTSVDMLLAADTSTTDATTAGAISRRRGNTWSIPLTLGVITGWTSLWFTVKNDSEDADTAALVQIKLNATGLLDGLLYINGAAATNDALGSITVSDASTGAIVVAVDETITDDLAPGEYYYDAQTLIAGAVATPDSGTFTITADVTRSVA
jgi:hypothetical protein